MKHSIFSICRKSRRIIFPCFVFLFIAADFDSCTPIVAPVDEPASEPVREPVTIEPTITGWQ